MGLGVSFTLIILFLTNFYFLLAAQTSEVVAVEAKKIETIKISSSALVETAKNDYQTGNFIQAIEKWQQALKIFSSTNDILNQSIVLSNLALAYQKLGNWQQANKTIEDSLNLLDNLETVKAKSLQAAALNIKGSLLLARGKTEEALNIWVNASKKYKEVGDNVGYIRSLINQSQALRRLGLYLRARVTLEEVNQSLKKESPSSLKAATLLNFGNTLRLLGDLQASEEALQQSLAIAEKLDSPNDIAAVLLSLGNNARDDELSEKALKYYQRAIVASKSPINKLQAQLNQLCLLIDMEKWHQAKELIAKIEPGIENLPPSRQAIYTKVNFVQSLVRIKDKDIDKDKRNEYSAKLLTKAIAEAQAIRDSRAESYALGYLGELYERTQQLAEAQKLTEQALILAQANNAADISYHWQWQLGRLFKKQNQIDKAVSAYSNAVATLSVISNDLVANNVNVQFYFRESVEPIYRELVDLLLQGESNENSNSKSFKSGKKVSQSNLKKARRVIESLQLAELDNYFREAYLTGSSTQLDIDKVDPQAAVIYPIILRDRLEVVLSLPNQTLTHYSSKISESELETNIEKMRRSLRRTSLKKERLAIAEKFYDLLIKPAEKELQANGVKTLAFMLDGSMKNLPMAVLYDGQQYLIEKYNLAVTPGLQLFAPQSLKHKNLKVLFGGLSESRQGFMSLPGVKTEINQIKSKISSQVLLNQKFTTKALEKNISNTPFPVVHLATHGQFSCRVKDTFILTWDHRINVKQLGNLLQNREKYSNNPIELLVLSACQTAQGDKRAALGLAGVAVRSGARSTVASLWAVDDRSTSIFMVEFYKQLAKPNVSKAEALRQAQLSLLGQRGFKHPFYWAPFVLVGNWL
ncbi:CHAT domain-containing protein [Mastigocoleus testarum]|uniref:CHAT domain-containing protein n=1 Tax=Mastigocoleus testarum TaxID=996925 RepID=UPI00041F6C5A|nr:CHAT domain-containing protein [Mastigocoleus testarum]